MLAIYVDHGRRWHPCIWSSSDLGLAVPIQYATMPNNRVFISINFLLPNRTYVESGYTAKTLRFFLLKLQYTSAVTSPCAFIRFLSWWGTFVNLFQFQGWTRENPSINKKHHPSTLAGPWAEGRGWALGAFRMAEDFQWITKRSQCVSWNYFTPERWTHGYMKFRIG
jgi:hypothetical protein